jgi:ankyrin repeat protein
LCTDFFGKALIKLDDTVASWPGATALHWATYGGYELTVKELIRQKIELGNSEVNLDQVDGILGQTALAVSCSQHQNERHTEIALALIEAGVDPTINNAQNQGPGNFCTMRNVPRVLKALNKYPSVLTNAYTTSKGTIWFPIVEASARQTSQTNTLRELVNASSVDPNQKGQDGRTALIYASDAALEVSFDFVKILLEDPVTNPSIQTTNNRDTALHIACLTMEMPVIRALVLDSRTNVNIKNANLDTPLQVAVRYSKQNKSPDVVEFLTSQKTAKNLELDSQDSSGASALYHAAQFGFKDVLQVLLDAGANVNLPDSNGNKPLKIVQGFLNSGKYEQPNYSGSGNLQLTFAANDASME